MKQFDRQLVSCPICGYSLCGFGRAENRFPALREGGKSEHQRARCRVTRACRAGIHAGGDAARRPDGQCHRKQTARISQERRVRVKRCGKSAPLEAQATRHGKPHRVQGQIGDLGAARSRFRASETGPGYWLHRQMILSARKSADRIRLTALPKPPASGSGPPLDRQPSQTAKCA